MWSSSSCFVFIVLCCKFYQRVIANTFHPGSGQFQSFGAVERAAFYALHLHNYTNISLNKLSNKRSILYLQYRASSYFICPPLILHLSLFPLGFSCYHELISFSQTLRLFTLKLQLFLSLKTPLPPHLSSPTSFFNCIFRLVPWRRQWWRTDLLFLWILSEFQCRSHYAALAQDLTRSQSLLHIMGMIVGAEIIFHPCRNEKELCVFFSLIQSGVCLIMVETKLFALSHFEYLVRNTKQKNLLFSHFQVKLVNIRNDDITDGNPKLTLGLIWTIILHFQVCALHMLFCSFWLCVSCFGLN